VYAGILSCCKDGLLVRLKRWLTFGGSAIDDASTIEHLGAARATKGSSRALIPGHLQLTT
jgi:hypothetical protein